MASPVGRVLGSRYEIVKHLASGGMGEVFLARTSGLVGFERYVVVKWIRAEVTRDESYVHMFLDEARVAASLHHNHIVQVHDVGHDDGEYYFAMEYVHGRDARQLLARAASRKEHVPIDHLLAIAGAAASGLHHAHEQLGPDRRPLGLVHRDVTPSNILIGFDGAVKVTDFGIAKAAHRSTQTHSGALKGKVGYMSPEQCRGQPLDRRADVFALGIVLYELATTRRLFKAESEFLTMSAIVGGTVPPPSRLRADLPPNLEAVILRALAHDRDDRFPTADAFRIALEGVAAELSLRASSLADYMKRMFGACPEPWLVDGPIADAGGAEPSGSGIASSPELSVSEIDTRAPIVRAHNRALTNAPPLADAKPARRRPDRIGG